MANYQINALHKTSLAPTTLPPLYTVRVYRIIQNTYGIWFIQNEEFYTHQNRPSI